MDLGGITTRARVCPGELAVTDGTSTLTWGELREWVVAVARQFAAVADGSRVGVTGENATHTLVAHAAGLVTGTGTVAVHRQASTTDLLHEVSAAQCSILVLGPQTAQAATELRDHSAILAVMHGAPPLPGLVAWEDWLAADTCDPAPRRGPANPLLVYTSGTTGRAKATPVHWTAPSETQDAARYLRAIAGRSGFPDGSHLVVGPLQHNGPLTAVRHLLAGQPVVIMPRFEPTTALRLVEQHRVTSTVMVPTHFSRLLALDDTERASYDVTSLQMVAHTGSACPAAVKRAMIDWLGQVLVESYGGSEIGTVARITSEEWLRHPGSVGRAVAPLEIAAYDGGRRLPAGQVGLLGVSLGDGRQVRFVGDEEKTRNAYLAEGVATLGDVGYVDEEGFVFITDRESDMVISGGVNLYPAECEQVLLRHPDVDDAAVIGLPDSDLGEVLHALIVPRRTVRADTLDEWTRAELTGYKCPKSYEFVTALPRNDMGKVNKRLLRAARASAT